MNLIQSPPHSGGDFFELNSVNPFLTWMIKQALILPLV